MVNPFFNNFTNTFIIYLFDFISKIFISTKAYNISFKKKHIKYKEYNFLLRQIYSKI